MICGIVWKEYFSLPMDHSGSCCARQTGKYIYIFNPMASDRAIFFGEVETTAHIHVSVGAYCHLSQGKRSGGDQCCTELEGRIFLLLEGTSEK